MSMLLIYDDTKDNTQDFIRYEYISVGFMFITRWVGRKWERGSWYHRCLKMIIIKAMLPSSLKAQIYEHLSVAKNTLCLWQQGKVS
jgi:hypothetical protein